MPLDPDRLMTLDLAARRVDVAPREAILYALAIGLGAGEGELPFAWEEALAIAPTFALSLAFDDAWIEPAGVPLASIVHGGLDVRFLAPLAAPGAADIAPRVVGLDDKGAGRGGVIHSETSVSQAGAPRCVIGSNLFVRGGGGFGGPVGRQMAAQAPPDRAADLTVEVATTPAQALLFRLLGDRNRLHVDPASARAAGFDRPILHGACTFGVACATILRAFCALDPTRLRRLAARFSAPVYPGETLVFRFWRDGEAIRFRAQASERGVVALDGGLAEVAT